MRYSLLNYLRCPMCRSELTCVTEREVAAPMPAVIMAPSARVSSADAAVGPVPAFRSPAPLSGLLAALGTAPAPPERNYEIEVEAGVMVCGECGRWYPIADRIPELLPDHLRDWTRDRAALEAMARVPGDLRDALARFDGGPPNADAGAHYKHAEIGIKDKISDPTFFGPGYSSPFNLWNPDFTLYLINLFGNVVPLLEAKPNSVILDSGCGYGWTTEWLFKSGFESIGVDICRTYLEVGIQRMGPFRPHVLVADVENLPIADASADAVLAYESFHHVPNRPRAIEGFARALKPGGRLVLAEPGGEHETADVSVETMAKYGVLEKGMELDDVRSYIEGTALTAPEQVHLLKVEAADLQRVAFLFPAGRLHEVLEGNVFTMRKAAADVPRGRGEGTGPRRPRERTGNAAAAPRPRPSRGVAAAVEEPFDEYYFSHCCGRPYVRDEEWLAFFARIADRLVSDVAPARVLDAGCAMGLLVEALRARGVEAYGIDLSAYAIERVDERVKPFCRRGSIVDPFPFGDRYDLIVSIEVLEHVPAAEAQVALDNICRHTDDVLFSSTPNDYREPTHVNVHPPEYWGEQFARRGFVRDAGFDATFITPWAVRFRRNAEPFHRVVANYERQLSDLVAERHDVREYSAGIQRELADALGAIEELRALQQRLSAEWTAQAERMVAEVRGAQTDLAAARETIGHMERSAFWKLRRVWVRVARLLGRAA